MICLVSKIDNFKVHFIVQFCNVLDEKGYRNSASFVVEWTGQTEVQTGHSFRFHK